MSRFSICVLLLGALLIYSCSNTGDEENAFAKVGGKTLPRESYQWFNSMLGMYPAQKNPHFPGNRQPATALVETQVLFREATGKNKLKSSRDWQWKQRYYPAQLFTQQILAQNLGFTEQEIEQYYSQHREEFKDTVSVKIPADTAAADSLVQPQTKDSVIYRPMTDVRPQIIMEMFLSEYPPDSAFYAQMVTPGDTAVDSSTIRQRWFMNARRDPATFFMRVFYEQKFKESYPDSIDSFYGEGQFLTPEDLEVILEWLPENARQNYNDPSKQRYLVEWLLKWRLFSERARESGFMDNEDVRGVLDWAWKYEVASDYVRQTLLPQARANVSMDTSMVKYAIWDEGFTAGKTPDSTRLATSIEEYKNQAISFALEEQINSLRRETGVEFLQSDWSDIKNANPTDLKQKADSLLALEEKKTGTEAAGLLRNAAQTLSELANTFFYTETGKEALIELAKVQTELAHLEREGIKQSQMLREAIRSYRRFLIFSQDAQRRCNTFFMIGFIYDEHLELPALAEVNYKWILEKTPDCELADDAEFMVQHLNEPMASIEELQAQSRRQGRPIDQEEMEDLSDTTVNADSIID